MLDLLVGSGWELVAIEKVSDGRIYDQWTIRSVRRKWGYELLVRFVEMESNWWRITAAAGRPRDGDDTPAIARMTLGRGRYDQAITAFVRELDDHRAAVAWPSDPV